MFITMSPGLKYATNTGRLHTVVHQSTHSSTLPESRSRRGHVHNHPARGHARAPRPVRQSTALIHVCWHPRSREGRDYGGARAASNLGR